MLEVENGVHPYTPENYAYPKEPEVQKQLEWFKDQKLGFMMHWGLYCQLGITESWPLVDNCGHWAKNEIDWIEDVQNTGAEEFKRQYWDLIKTFNPIRFEPQKWADLIADNGFKYCIVTTKHHDGFCMYDTKYTDYKITSPECPFSTNKNANALKILFDAFRAKGMGIGAYFSKADWHCEDFWEDHGIGHYTDSHPTYNVMENPEKWQKFKDFTRNQIVEIVRDLGKVDIFWMDAGWVRPLRNLGIDIEDIIAEARRYNPGLISVDRNNAGQTENYITPEQKVPEAPLECPWESCISMANSFSYRYEDRTYKSPRKLIHMLLDVVAKGGNLALNVSPSPDGRIPSPAIERIKIMGEWLRKNGDGIYGTRIAAPYKVGDFAFTGKGESIYSFKLNAEGEVCGETEIIPFTHKEFKAVRHLGTGTNLKYEIVENGIKIWIPDSVERDEYADGFEIILK